MTGDTAPAPPAIDDFRVFVPAKDFTTSLAFYQALGWTMTWTDGDGLALLELGGHRFLLQDFYVKKWAENFMVTVAVPDAAAWLTHASAVLGTGEYGSARVAQSKVEDWGATVTPVWDPSGVLLLFTQFHDQHPV